MHQYEALEDKIDGFSKRLTGGRETLETLNQALNEVTGTMSRAAVTLQTTGEHARETNDRIKKISDTTQEADGTVKGFNESQDTLNAKMRDAKAAFGGGGGRDRQRVYPGDDRARQDAKCVGDEMAKHPGIAHGVVTALEVLGGAWLGFKALNIAETILTPIAKGLGGIIAGEEGAAAGAGRLKGALGGLGAVGVGLAAGDIIDSTAADQAKKHPDNPFWKGANQFLHFPGSGFGAINCAENTLPTAARSMVPAPTATTPCRCGGAPGSTCSPHH